MGFRNDIQGFRAFSFLIVFIFHINSIWLPGGFLGVDLFFVISGYLMTAIISNQIETKKFNFKQFYINRIKRIVPAYYVFIVITAIVTSIIYLYTDFDTLKNNIIYSTLFVSNRLFSTGESYFGARLNENPFLHTWSLAIEMQFYFFLPLIMLLFKKYIKPILVFVIIILTAYSSYKIYVLDQKQVMYFSLVARVPEFLIGGLLAISFRNGINVNKVTTNLLAIFLFLTIIICTVLINEQTPYPGIIALIPCTAAAVLLSLKSNYVSLLFSSKPLVYIGELSYSLYLWHFPVMALVRYRSDDNVLSIQQIIFVIILTVLLAMASYYFIEKKSKKIQSKTIVIGLIGLGLLLITYAFGIKKIFKYKDIDERYSKREFGRASHNSLKLEKFGNDNTNDKIFLFGDSHAWSLKPLFHYIGQNNNFSFTTLTVILILH